MQTDHTYGQHMCWHVGCTAPWSGVGCITTHQKQWLAASPPRRLSTPGLPAHARPGQARPGQHGTEADAFTSAQVAHVNLLRSHGTGVNAWGSSKYRIGPTAVDCVVEVAAHLHFQAPLPLLPAGSLVQPRPGHARTLSCEEPAALLRQHCVLVARWGEQIVW